MAKATSNPESLFEPYSLNSLDYIAPEIHLNPIFFFDLFGKSHVQACRRLKEATASLVLRLPIVTGMIAPKVNYDDKALEVRSATASEVQEYPMLVIEHHPNGTPISVNGTTNPIFEPFPHVTPPRTPSPVIRFKANIVGESLIMVWCIDHRAMDGSAGLAVVKAFATLCQDPTAPCDVLFPTPDKNKKARKYLMEIKSLSQPYSVKWPFKPSGCRGSGLHSKRPLISSSLLLDPLKIELLRKACEYARESVCHHKNEVCHPPLATLSVLCALAGILGAQARSKALPGEQAHSSNIIFAANAVDMGRDTCTPMLPLYFGMPFRTLR